MQASYPLGKERGASSLAKAKVGSSFAGGGYIKI